MGNAVPGFSCLMDARLAQSPRRNRHSRQSANELRHFRVHGTTHLLVHQFTTLTRGADGEIVESARDDDVSRRGVEIRSRASEPARMIHAGSKSAMVSLATASPCSGPARKPDHGHLRGGSEHRLRARVLVEVLATVKRLSSLEAVEHRLELIFTDGEDRGSTCPRTSLTHDIFPATDTQARLSPVSNGSRDMVPRRVHSMAPLSLLIGTTTAADRSARFRLLSDVGVSGARQGKTQAQV